MGEIEFTCPQCGTEYSAPLKRAGTTLTCRECDGPVRVPDRLPVIAPVPQPTVRLTPAEAERGASGLQLLQVAAWLTAGGWGIGLAAVCGYLVGPARDNLFAAGTPLAKLSAFAVCVLLTAGLTLRALAYVRFRPAAARTNGAGETLYGVVGAVLNGAAGVLFVSPWCIGPGYRDGPQPGLLATAVGGLLLGRLAEWSGLNVFRRTADALALPKTAKRVAGLRFVNLLPVVFAANIGYGLLGKGTPSVSSSLTQYTVGTGRLSPADANPMVFPVVMFAAVYIGVGAWEFAGVFGRLRRAVRESAEVKL